MGLWRLFVREKWQTAVNVFNDQMKKTLLFCLSMTLVVVAYAVPRSAKQALELAERFVGAAQSVYGASPRTLSLSVSAETNSETVLRAKWSLHTIYVMWARATVLSLFRAMTGLRMCLDIRRREM